MLPTKKKNWWPNLPLSRRKGRTPLRASSGSVPPDAHWCGCKPVGQHNRSLWEGSGGHSHGAEGTRLQVLPCLTKRPSQNHATTSPAWEGAWCRLPLGMSLNPRCPTCCLGPSLGTWGFFRHDPWGKQTLLLWKVTCGCTIAFRIASNKWKQ